MPPAQPTVTLIGAPLDLCGPELGSRLGPAAMRLVGITETLHKLGLQTVDAGDAFAMVNGVQEPYVDRLSHALEAYRDTKRTVEGAIHRGHLPILVGGDHSVSIGSIAGALAALPAQNVGVLWIDAHMDLNTPATSPSGNFHGMPVAALLRLPAGKQDTVWFQTAKSAWQEILDTVVPDPGLQPDKICWVGLRDVDNGELANLEAIQNNNAYTMQDVDHIGVSGLMQKVKDWIVQNKVRHLWVSFDIDSLDPALAPGTGTSVRGGLSYREGHLLAELLHEMLIEPHCPCKLAGLDLVEVNPMTDDKGATAKVTNEWLSSFFGKKIMGPQDRSGILQ